MANDQTWYANVFKTWQVKQQGPKPSAELLGQVHSLGLLPGKQAMTVAMSLRDCGVSRAQVYLTCGNPQFNRMGGLVDDALIKRVQVPKTADGHMVYKHELTAKGIKRIEAAVKRATALDEAGKAGEPAKPVKGKGKAKARKPAKAKPVEPAVEAPQVDGAAGEPEAVTENKALIDSVTGEPDQA